MKTSSVQNAMQAKKTTDPPRRVSKVRTDGVHRLLKRYQLSIATGDAIWLDGHCYVTHSGLLRIARFHHCHGIEVTPATEFCDPAGSRWAFKATVYKSRNCKGFVGYGDADPSNVSALVRGAEMRVAETRAVNRALRKAYGIGICSVEELGARIDAPPSDQPRQDSTTSNQPVNGNGHPLRNRLCLLVRQHRLDAALVKAYAADYCEVAEVRQATREQISDFIQHLAQYAVQDREGLLCQLNSYAPKPVAPATVPAPNGSQSAEEQKDAGVA